ncbi:hypothetical protein DH2020_024029 [Rehmannia glutinosa]|uniref:Uncharacterized protein n=1 Tax=Rehmannia glutinosa TaxID=99300 RepID=A0ABR0WA70_REHGL
MPEQERILEKDPVLGLKKTTNEAEIGIANDLHGLAVEGINMLKWPKKIRSMPGRRDNGKYFHFHKDHGRDTEECFQLKDEIERLIQHGYLKIFVRIKEGEAEDRRHGKDARLGSPPRYKSRGRSEARFPAKEKADQHRERSKARRC